MEKSFEMFNLRLMSSPPILPVVFHNLISKWPALRWTPASLVDEFGDESIQFRVGRIANDTVQYETECYYVSATMREFNEWTCSEACSASNPLCLYSRELYWCYADYKHLNDMFLPGHQRDTIMSSINWSELGFKERNGDESTFWLGTKGAYTVCHYDTYGCNLVVQIYGRKRWILFPPSQTNCLYPTRIPYEESSVFSQVNIRCPDWSRHAQFRQCTSYEVVLEPGDILYVPHLWWHFVENLETSISVNTWLDLGPTDDHERIKEAVTRTLVHMIMTPDKSCDLDTWLNTTEILTSHAKNLDYIHSAVLAVSKKKNIQKDETLNKSIVVTGVKRRSDPEEKVLSVSSDNLSPAKKLCLQRNNETATDANFAIGVDRYPYFISAEFEARHLEKIYPRSIEQVLDNINSDFKKYNNVKNDDKVTDKMLTSCTRTVIPPSDDMNCRDASLDCAGVGETEAVYGPGAGDQGNVLQGFTSTDLAAVLLHPDVIDVIYSKLVDRYHL